VAEGPVIGGYLTELQRATADGVPVKGHPRTHAEAEHCVLPRSRHPDPFAQALRPTCRAHTQAGSDTAKTVVLDLDLS